VTQGSEQAINSMRSQLLICLEKFRGIVVFATNLVENYDSAFETRVRHVHFPLPDAAARRLIWREHLPQELPLAADVDVDALANLKDELSGREIKNAVVATAIGVAASGRKKVDQRDLLDSVGKLVSAREAVRAKNKPAGQPLSESEKSALAEKLKSKLNPNPTT
jgi:ATP-dependent 26S proteasome regulatory subunit